MWQMISRFLTGAGLALLLPAAASASGLCHKDDGTCPKNLGCWIWNCKEVEECVFDVTYKEVKQKIKVPYIREIKETISCKVCKPFDSTSLRDCPVTNYARSADTVNVTKCQTVKDECGNCHTEQTCEPHVKTCLTRCEVTRQIPVLEWQLIPVEDKITKVYYVQDWKDEEVVLRIPVKTPKTITRKIWTRVPAPCGCDAGCPTCTEPAPAEELAPAPVEEEVKPDPVPTQ